VHETVWITFPELPEAVVGAQLEAHVALKDASVVPISTSTQQVCPDGQSSAPSHVATTASWHCPFATHVGGASPQQISPVEQFIEPHAIQPAVEGSQPAVDGARAALPSAP
jgi:hypothetical protein